MTTPGRVHPNRRPHNEAVYVAIDAFIERHVDLYRGVLIDLGCGEAPYRTFFEQHAQRYVGVDWSGARGRDVVADLNRSLPFADGVAETVVSISVLEHLSEPERMLSEAFRILRPGGHLLLQVPFQWHVHEAPHDFFRYTRYGLEHLLKKAGFIDVDVAPMTGFWTMWVLKLNYQTMRLIRGPRAARWLVRQALRPLWWLDQSAARALDRVWPAEGETAGYAVTATRP